MSKNKREVRDSFRNDVFKRDNYTCKVCGYGPFEYNPVDIFDAHHITDRSKMPNGGYVKENGITVCKDAKPNFAALIDPELYHEIFTMLSCHMRCEQFHISDGENWEEGLHPDDLYKKVDSSLELAIRESKKL